MGHPSFWILGAVEAVIWYFFIWYFLDTVRSMARTDRKERNLWVAAGVLLALFYLGFVACPWVRHTEAWKDLFK